MAGPVFIAPSTRTFLNMGRELVVGTPTLATPQATMPLDQNDYNPEDTPKFLPDEAIRGVMTPLFNEIRGVQNATFSLGGPMFLDIEGFMLDNVFGDMSTTSNGTLGTAPTLASAIAVGATQLTASGSIGSPTTGSVIQITDGAASEVVLATSGVTGTNILFANTPTRFAHSTSATVSLQTVAGGYTHKFAILNTGNGQPPTHSMTDYTGLTTSVGARTYPSFCVSQLDISGNTEQMLMRKVSGESWQSSPAGTTPTAATSFVLPQANWRSTVTIGGTQINDIGNWACSIKRKLQTYWTATNTQTPYIIARGGLTMTYTFDWTVAENENALSEMLTQGYLATVITLDNGLSSTNRLNITITSTTAQAVKSKPERTAVLVGYGNTMEAVANATDAGGSGGQGPGTVSIINNSPTY
jgi:hypothetical protein